MSNTFTLVPRESISGTVMETQTYDLMLTGHLADEPGARLGYIRAWRHENGVVEWLVKSYHNWSPVNPTEHITPIEGATFASLDECLEHLAKHGYTHV